MRRCGAEKPFFKNWSTEVYRGGQGSPVQSNSFMYLELIELQLIELIGACLETLGFCQILL